MPCNSAAKKCHHRMADAMAATGSRRCRCCSIYTAIM
jgi:hypothetical protein